jgi:hypothetical protein
LIHLFLHSLIALSPHYTVLEKTDFEMDPRGERAGTRSAARGHVTVWLTREHRHRAKVAHEAKLARASRFARTNHFACTSRFARTSEFACASQSRASVFDRACSHEHHYLLAQAKKGSRKGSRHASKTRSREHFLARASIYGSRELSALFLYPLRSSMLRDGVLSRLTSLRAGLA